MAKTRGSHTAITGREPVQRPKATAVTPPESVHTDNPSSSKEKRAERRANRNLTKHVSDLGVSSKKLKKQGSKSKGKNLVSVSIPTSSHNLSNSDSAILFRSHKFAKQFQKLMVNKPIVFGKPVDPVLFHTIGVTAMFNQLGMNALLFPPTSAYPLLIKQFYGNLSVKNDKIQSFVQNKTISIDSALLGVLFDIPCSGLSPFTLKGPLEFVDLSVLQQLRIVKDCPTAEFVSLPTVIETTPLNSVIHKLIRANIIPRTGGRSEMTYQDLILSALILSKTKFNCALLMINHMESCVKTKSKCFPYGGFLTKVFAHFNISFEHEQVFQITEVIDDFVFANSKLKVGADNVLSWDVEEHIPDPTAPVASPPHSPTPSSIPIPPASQALDLSQVVNDMNSKFDTMLDLMHTFSASLNSLSDRIFTITERVDSLDTQFKSLSKKIEDGILK